MSARRTGPTAITVRAVRDRDGWACVRCGVPEATVPYQLTTQHRVSRGMGGTRRPELNQTANLATLCGSGTTGCHGWVEDHPVIAREHGWAVARWNDPTVVPMWTWHGWVRLDNTAGLELVPAPDFDCDCGCQIGRAS